MYLFVYFRGEKRMVCFTAKLLTIKIAQRHQQVHSKCKWASQAGIQLCRLYRLLLWCEIGGVSTGHSWTPGLGSPLPRDTPMSPRTVDTAVAPRAALQIRRVALLHKAGAINWVPVLLPNDLLGKCHLALQTANGHLFMAFPPLLGRTILLN